MIPGFGTVAATQPTTNPFLQRSSTMATSPSLLYPQPSSSSSLLPSTTTTPPLLFSFMPLSAPPQNPSSMTMTPMATAPASGSLNPLVTDVYFFEVSGLKVENSSSMTKSQGVGTGARTQARRGSADATKGDGYDLFLLYPFSGTRSSNQQRLGMGSGVTRKGAVATKSEDVFYPSGLGSGATRKGRIAKMADDEEDLVSLIFKMLGKGARMTMKGKDSNDKDVLYYPFSAVKKRGWSTEEDDEGLHLSVEMPGLGKEHVKVSVEKNSILIIHGEVGEEGPEPEPEPEESDESSESEESNSSSTTVGGTGRNYNFKFQFPEDVFKLDAVKGEIKNGLLELTVPKLKKEERKDVLQIQLD